MALSYQQATSDGTLAFLDVSIDYLDRSEISVYFDNVVTALWSWSGTEDKRILFSPVVPNGVGVLVKRITDATELRHVFSTGAAFTAQSLDEDLEQALHIAQEAREGNASSEFFADLNMHGFKVTNMGMGTNPNDAVTLAQYQADASGAAASAAAAAVSAAAAAASAADAVLLRSDLAAPDGSTRVGYNLGAVGGQNRTVRERLRYERWVEDLIPAGATYHSAYFSQAAALGGTWHCGPGPFTFDPTGGCVGTSGFRLICHGTKITHNTNTLPTFQFNDAEDWGILGSLEIFGSGANPSSPGSAIGIARVAGRRFEVHNVVCKSINGWGFKEINGTSIVGTRGDRGNWVNCRAYDCLWGREDIASDTTEYNQWINFTASGNRVGNITAAGNNRFIGGNIVDNLDGGVWLKPGGNHLHGAFVGVAINHNGPNSGGYNIRCTDVTNGQLFSGCSVYADNPGTGVIWFERCQGVMFTAGIMDASLFCDGTIGYNYVVGNFAPDSANTNGKYGPGGPSDVATAKVIVSRNFARTGSWKYNDPASACFVRASRSGTQSITSGVATPLVFNAASFDTRLAYAASTGVFTAPWLGNYRVTGSVRISAASGIPATGGFITLLVNGSAAFFAPISAYSGTLGIASFAFTVGGAAGTTIAVAASITGTTLAFDLGQLTIEELT